MTIQPTSLVALPPLVLILLLALASVRNLFLLIGLIIALRGMRDGFREKTFAAYAHASWPWARPDRLPDRCPTTDVAPTI